MIELGDAGNWDIVSFMDLVILNLESSGLAEGVLILVLVFCLKKPLKISSVLISDRFDFLNWFSCSEIVSSDCLIET